jgi:hypothetical protein
MQGTAATLRRRQWIGLDALSDVIWTSTPRVFLSISLPLWITSQNHAAYGE